MKFTLYWLDGKKEEIHGNGYMDAFAKTGYGIGAISALDFYTDEEYIEENGEDNYVYDSVEKTWRNKQIIELTNQK